MPVIQEAVDLSAGRNFIPNRMRYRLPMSKTNNSVFLLSDSYEYDIELIKKIPPPKTDYKQIVIPFKVIDKIEVKPFRYIMTQNEFNKKLTYLEDQKLLPKLIPIRYPYPKTIENNIYIPISEIFKMVTPYLRQMPIQKIKAKIFSLFNQIMFHFNWSKNKILVIDVTRFPVYQTLNMDTYKSDLINALLTAYMFNPPDTIKKMDWTIIFRAPDVDYKFDLRTWDKRDLTLLRNMLKAIGKPNATTAKTNEEAGESVDDFMGQDEEVSDSVEGVSGEVKGAIDEVPNESEQIGGDVDISDPEITGLLERNRSVTDSLKSTLSKYQSQLPTSGNPETTTNTEKQLYNAKTLSINAQLISRINPDKTTVSNYETIANDLTPAGDTPVEKQIIDKAAKELSHDVQPVDTSKTDTVTTSARELKIRKQVGQLKLNNVTFDTLSTVTDTPMPIARKPRHIVTTCPAAQKSTPFASIAKEYEDKLLDRDIVATFMNLSALPDGFYVANVEVTDISTATTLMNNWRVTLKNKSSDKSSVINIRVPKVINGRFYNNGIWYNIGKQDFPIPILKISKKKVIITTNYNKITVERYDTKSLVDIGMFTKTINAMNDAAGKNKYVKPGNSINTNSRFESTIEYDEYAKQWISFINKEANCEIYFNRTVCLKAFQYVTVQPNEFCCGMINKVPVVINTETGLTRDGRTLTDTMLRTLPGEYIEQYNRIKPGKLSMYTQIIIGQTMPLGVAIAAWEGITSLLRKSGVKALFVDKSFNDSKYFTIPFKDKILAIPLTTPNQLIFNGFYRIPTKSFNFADFDTTIMNSNSIYVDIFNQQFFKQYSQLTTFITYYQFFVDAITKDVCLHYNIPNDIAGMLIYASNMLADNSFTGENHSSLYRIRSSEIIPAIIHYRLAYNISKYNNSVGSKSRSASFNFNPNEVLNELLAVPNVTTMSALNPMVELHAREEVTKKGFSGVNDDRAYNVVKRSYDDSMIGKIAMSSPNSGNVGISRQLTADPKLTSVRGYTDTIGPDADYNDFQLASCSELETPGTVSRDDAIRTAIATSQTSHIVSTADAQPCLISNGFDEVVPAYLTDEFSVLADEDGKVLEETEDYLIVQYKSGKKRSINIGHRQSFNSGSGFYVDNKLLSNFHQGDSFKKDDILAYHERFFSKDSDGIVRENIGPLAKVAFTGIYSTYEDAGIMTAKMSKRLATRLTMKQMFKLNAIDDVEKIVQVGDEIEVGDPLITFGLGDTGDKAVDNFLKAFQDKDGSNSAVDSAKRVMRSKEAGTVVDVKIYTCKSMDRLSPSLYDIVDKHFKENIKRRRTLDKYEKGNNVYKMGMLYDRPTEPLKGSTIKGITCDVLVEIYIEHEDEASVGDKCVAYAASKQVLSEVIPEGMEPYSETRPDEEISMFVAPASILKRMIPSIVIIASGNKVLVEAKRKIREIWEKG